MVWTSNDSGVVLTLSLVMSLSYPIKCVALSTTRIPTREPGSATLTPSVTSSPGLLSVSLQLRDTCHHISLLHTHTSNRIIYQKTGWHIGGWMSSSVFYLFCPGSGLVPSWPLTSPSPPQMFHKILIGGLGQSTINFISTFLCTAFTILITSHLLKQLKQ